MTHRWALFLTVAISAATALPPPKDDFVVVLNCYAGFEARIAAGRAARQGLKTVVVTNALWDDTAELRTAVNETWLLHEGGRLEDVAAFVAYEHLGNSFKWMFVGEDDTLFFRRGAETAIKNAAEDIPYFIQDAAWFVGHEGARHYLKAEAPRCVPCGYTKDPSLLPEHFRRECPCTTMDNPPEGSCGPHKMPSMEYFPHSGSGYLLSAALLQKIPLNEMTGCLMAGENANIFTCLWKMGIAATDPDPAWHPEGLTHFDPMPSPFLTHENIIEKTAFVLGQLLREATGLCTDICQVEAEHLVSLHLNGARIGFTRSGERLIGDFKDAGQREFVGQVLLGAISRFFRDEFLPPSEASRAPQEFAGSLWPDPRTPTEVQADARIAAAKQMLQSMESFFKGDLLGEGDVDRSTGALTKLTTTERARKAVATAIARQALDIVVQECTGDAIF